MKQLKLFILKIKKYIDYKMQVYIENKILRIKNQIEDSIYVMLSELEKESEELVRLGIHEKSKILMAVFEEYPILFKCDKKTELIKWIDSVIDSAFDDFKVRANWIDSNNHK